MTSKGIAGLVALAFVSVGVLTPQAVAQVGGITVSPNPAQVGSIVTITVNATPFCTGVSVDVGEGTPIQLSSSPGGWPQSIQHTYGIPAGSPPWNRGITATGNGGLCTNQQLASLTLTPALTLLPPGDVFEQLCRIVSTGVCSSTPLPVPTITSVSGCREPGCDVFVHGKNFGYPIYGSPGKLLLKGNFPGGVLDLQATSFTDVYVRGRIPSITGVLDQSASLQVITAKQVASNAMAFAFTATREIIPVPTSAVTISCSSAGGVNLCVPAPPASFMGFHQDGNSTCNWNSTAVGMDQYDLTLKNGWRVNRMTTTDLRTNQFTTNSPSAAQTSFKVGWNTQNLCWMSYIVNFTVIGPKGVPVQ